MCRHLGEAENRGRAGQLQLFQTIHRDVNTARLDDSLGVARRERLKDREAHTPKFVQFGPGVGSTKLARSLSTIGTTSAASRFGAAAKEPALSMARTAIRHSSSRRQSAVDGSALGRHEAGVLLRPRGPPVSVLFS